jgi:hypothetical protein
MRTAADADSNSYYRIHWPEMKVQEVVDTIDKLRRESQVSMIKPAKTGSMLALPDFKKCPHLAFYIGTLSCESGQNRRCPAESELPMHKQCRHVLCAQRTRTSRKSKTCSLFESAKWNSFETNCIPR